MTVVHQGSTTSAVMGVHCHALSTRINTRCKQRFTNEVSSSDNDGRRNSHPHGPNAHCVQLHTVAHGMRERCEEVSAGERSSRGSRPSPLDRSISRSMGVSPTRCTRTPQRLPTRPPPIPTLTPYTPLHPRSPLHTPYTCRSIFGGFSMKMCTIKNFCK